MAFGFSMDRGGCSLSFWNEAQGRAEHPALSWGRGKPYFESCLMVEPSGLQLGAGARVRFRQADSEAAAADFLDDISAQLLGMPPTRFPARQDPLSGQQLLEEFFQIIGGELRAAGTEIEHDVLAVAAPAALGPGQEERLRRCAEHTGLRAQVYPSWFLQTLCCLNADPAPPHEGKILFLDYGADESCAVCCVLQRQAGRRTLFPRAVVLAGNGLTHRGTAERLLQELLEGSSGSFRGLEAEETFRNRRDWGLLVQEAERVRAHLMGRGMAADFSVGGLYGNRYAERPGLTAEWFSHWLVHTGWQAAVQAMAQQALDRAGWTALQVDRVYISRRSGLPFRNAVLGLPGLAAKPCPQWQKSAMQAADGAALYAGRLGSPEQIGLLPERKLWFCCRTSEEAEDCVSRLAPLYSTETLWADCRRAKFAELFVLDAALAEGTAQVFRRPAQQRLTVPQASDPTLRICLDGRGGYSCTFFQGEEPVMTQSCKAVL